MADTYVLDFEAHSYMPDSTVGSSSSDNSKAIPPGCQFVLSVLQFLGADVCHFAQKTIRILLA